VSLIIVLFIGSISATAFVRNDEPTLHANFA
jgi:hypothetical protein